MIRAFFTVKNDTPAKIWYLFGSYLNAYFISAFSDTKVNLTPLDNGGLDSTEFHINTKRCTVCSIGINSVGGNCIVTALFFESGKDDFERTVINTLLEFIKGNFNDVRILEDVEAPTIPEPETQVKGEVSLRKLARARNRIKRFEEYERKFPSLSPDNLAQKVGVSYRTIQRDYVYVECYGTKSDK